MSILSNKYRLIIEKLLETPPKSYIGWEIAHLGPLGISVLTNDTPYCSIQDLEQIFDMPIDTENWQEDPLPAKFEKDSTDDITILRMILEQLNVIRMGTIYSESTSIYNPNFKN